MTDEGMPLAGRLESAIGTRPTRLLPLAGGCVADVSRAFFGEGGSVVVKSSATGGLECERWMLGYLAAHSNLPIAPGFFELRRDIYNLYPLLVHAILFGQGYARSVDAIVRRVVG